MYTKRTLTTHVTREENIIKPDKSRAKKEREAEKGEKEDEEEGKGERQRMAVRSLSTALARDGDSDDEVNAERRLRGTRRKETKTRNEGLRERGGPEFKRTMGWRRRESARGRERKRKSSSANANIRSDRD